MATSAATIADLPIPISSVGMSTPESTADADVWPRVTFDRCEANVPGLGEVWSAATALFLVVAGLVPLFTSKYSDEEIDLVSALVALNGVVSALSHSTLLRVFGQADALSLNVCALVYVKAMAAAHSPTLFAQPLRRGLLNLSIAFCILLTISWTPCNVAPSIAKLFDMPVVGLVPVMGLGLRYMVALAYGKATWHLGRLKRTFLRGTIIFILGFCGWMIEESEVLQSVMPCPAPFTLHALWHVSSAHALMAWAAFLKYHRGLFFGFRPELRGRWWCPYTVWEEPENPDENPIIRHTRVVQDDDDTQSPTRSPSRRSSTSSTWSSAGRRNSYSMPKARCRTSYGASAPQRANGGVRQLWRGASMHRMSSLEWLRTSRMSRRASSMSKNDDSIQSPVQAV